MDDIFYVNVMGLGGRSRLDPVNMFYNETKDHIKSGCAFRV
jgi:hypothetical protein